jgi:glutamyl-tRNA reductase
MQQLVVIAASYRTASVADLGRLALDRGTLAPQLPRLRDAVGAQGLVYLGTCNRIELVVDLADARDLHELRSALLRALAQAGGGARPDRAPEAPAIERSFRIRVGEAALEHVICVACGLDSARIGDREIAAQLRDAWLVARRAGASSGLLDDAMVAALSTAREAVTLVPHGTGGPGFAQRAARLVLERVPDDGRPVALVGVSPMTRSAGRMLAAAGRALLVVNRSAAAREQFAVELGATSLDPEAFWHGGPAVAAVICAVGTVERVADAAKLEGLRRASAPQPPLVVDLGVPENIGAEAAGAAGLPFVGMHDLVQAAAAGRPDALLDTAAVQALIDRRIERAARVAAVRAAGPLLGALRLNYEARLEAELERLLHAELGGLDARQALALRGWGRRLAHRMAHVPLQGLRALASRVEPEQVVDCVRAMHAALDGERRTGA